MASHDRFGYAWNKYNSIFPIHEEQFQRWIGPIEPKDFKGADVLDAGCGMGRNSLWTAKYGARRIVAFDYDKRSVDATKRTLVEYPHAEIRFASIYDITYREEFDIVFSVGVIHHLDRPEEALRRLFQAVRPGGVLVIWVYGRENNLWKIAVVNSVRWLTSRLPIGFVHILTYLFSVPLYLLVKLFPVRSEYLRFMSQSQFRHIHHTVFDQLLPRVAHYWTREEVAALVGTLPDPKKIELYHVLKYSWCAVVRKYD